MSVYGFSAEEEARGAREVHQPGYQEASAYADDERDEEEQQACGVELQVGNKLLAEDGEDGREDVEEEAVATEERDPPSPFRGSISVEPKQGGDGCVGYQDRPH